MRPVSAEYSILVMSDLKYFTLVSKVSNYGNSFHTTTLI